MTPQDRIRDDLIQAFEEMLLEVISDTPSSDILAAIQYHEGDRLRTAASLCASFTMRLIEASHQPDPELN